jgi:2-polyprenyl-3-methyl-5-hydroxy-6-metoxy-1,4-benzoquinol methylase
MAGLLPHSLRIVHACLEIGCGIGTMVERMVRKGLFKHVEYTGIDLQPEIIADAAQQMIEWSKPGFPAGRSCRGDSA